jgi:hypothetical protein
VSLQISNTWNGSCNLPPLWSEDGTEVDPVSIGLKGCYASEFDQFGDMDAFGNHPYWQRELSKFASVQDRLREWDYDVMQKIRRYSCMTIKALDIDAVRVDKSTQMTLDALASWTTSTKACAAAVGKTNFFVVGEVTGGDTFGSLYMYASIALCRPLTTNNISKVAVVAFRLGDQQIFFRPPISQRLTTSFFCAIVHKSPSTPMHSITPFTVH